MIGQKNSSSQNRKLRLSNKNNCVGLEEKNGSFSDMIVESDQKKSFVFPNGSDEVFVRENIKKFLFASFVYNSKIVQHYVALETFLVNL